MRWLKFHKLLIKSKCGDNYWHVTKYQTNLSCCRNKKFSYNLKQSFLESMVKLVCKYRIRKASKEVFYVANKMLKQTFKTKTLRDV